MSQLADRCPECAAEIAVVPWRIRAVTTAGVRADYRCGCGHEWFTGWEIPVASEEDAA